MRWRARRTPLGVVIAVAVALGGCGDDARVQPGPDSGPVPRVTGLTLAEAEQRLQASGAPWVLDGDGQIHRVAASSSGGVNRALARATVVAQQPRAGDRLLPEDAVLLRMKR